MKKNPTDAIVSLLNQHITTAARTAAGPVAGSPTVALQVTQAQANLLLLALESHEHQVIETKEPNHPDVHRCQELWNLVFTCGVAAGFKERE
mgnify:CR=1 FL=1